MKAKQMIAATDVARLQALADSLWNNERCVDGIADGRIRVEAADQDDDPRAIDSDVRITDGVATEYYSFASAPDAIREWADNLRQSEFDSRLEEIK